MNSSCSCSIGDGSLPQHPAVTGRALARSALTCPLAPLAQPRHRAGLPKDGGGGWKGLSHARWSPKAQNRGGGALGRAGGRAALAEPRPQVPRARPGVGASPAAEGAAGWEVRAPPLPGGGLPSAAGGLWVRSERLREGEKPPAGLLAAMTPPPPARPYLQQVRPQLLGHTVQGPRAARLSPRVSKTWAGDRADQ